MATKNKKLLNKLNLFHSDLKSYKAGIELLSESKTILGHWIRNQDTLREKLLRESGELSEIITELISTNTITIYEFGKPRSVNVWDMALRAEIDYRTIETLNASIDYTLKAIGKLEDDIRKGKRDEQGNILNGEKTSGEKDSKKPELPIETFDAMQFHLKVVEASRQLFKDGHYRDAIYRAFVEVNNFVKDKSNSQLDGKKLMSTAFSLEKPLIKLNSLQTQSDKDEQEGFMFLFMGAMEGIRNPKAHLNIIQDDPYITLEYLGLASFLIKRIDFWEAGNV